MEKKISLHLVTKTVVKVIILIPFCALTPKNITNTTRITLQRIEKLDFNISGKPYPVRVNSSNINLVGTLFLKFFLKILLVREGLVTDVDVILEGEGELSIGEVMLGHCENSNMAKMTALMKDECIPRINV